MGGSCFCGEPVIWPLNLMIAAVSASRGWNVGCPRHADLSWLDYGADLGARSWAGGNRASGRNVDDGLDRQRTAKDADFAHRIGHLDARAPEGVPQRQHRLALHIVHSVGIG